jgi:A/G-specific adenine glycosylase
MSEVASVAQLRRVVWNHYKKHGRHDLPWRKSHNPYHVLVSEMMLQQTQVDRVIPYFRTWLKTFPTVRSLAKAPLSNVLRHWQGLGYNRRAKMLHESAKMIVEQHKGVIPKTAEELEGLRGVGPYTARAVMAFAHNADVVFVETNIRTVITHHFYPGRKKVADTEILNVLERALPRGKSREWYSALMDYGAHLKRSGVKLNARAKGYAKQKAFAGSDREVRGAIIKVLTERPRTKPFLLSVLGTDRRAQSEMQLQKLVKEGMIERHASRYQLPQI